MSNFKEIYPQRNFREDLYRMDSLGKDDYEVLAYNGIPSEAPLASDYCYALENHFKTARGKSLSIRDAIDAPVKKIKIYGNAEYDLSEEYIRLYYIQPSAKGSYIMLNYTTENMDIKKEEIIISDVDGSGGTLNGAWNGSGQRTGSFGRFNNGLVSFGCGNMSVGSGSWYIDNVYYNKKALLISEVNFNTKRVTAKWKDRFIINDGYNSGITRTTNKLMLFGITKDDEPSEQIVCRIYDYKLYNNDELLCHLIPVKRKQDNAIGMLDIINNIFYNSGNSTRPFIGGPEMGGGTITNPVEIKSVGTFREEAGQWETLITCNDIKTKLVHEQPLCNIGEEYVDYYDDGVIYYNTIYSQLLSSSNWQIDNTLTTDSVLVVSLFIPSAINQTDYVYCTHFSPSSDMTVPNHIKIDNQRIYLSLDRTDISNLNQFVDWLKNNKVIVIYNRKRSKKVLVEPKIILKTYDGTTNITNNQNAEMEIEYRVAPNARVWKKQENGTFIELTS